MQPATADKLVEALRGRPILTQEQFAELEATHAPAHPDPQDLARALIRLGWLTVYQARKLVSGKGDELVVGSYVLLDKLGEGGMGRVFRAIQLNLHRVVALKVVRPHLLQSETALKRFEREVKAAAALRHPNIVAVFDADQVGERRFLAMEYIAGCDLARLVKDVGRLPVATACSYIRQAALGLQHAHNRGLVHRDIKPSNLLVAAGDEGAFTEKNVVKILDMGLARTQPEDEEQPGTELTRAGTVIGTPDYMSPEQAKDSREVDHRSDLYSLGCTFFHLLAGEVPFPKGSAVEKLLQHQMEEAPPVQRLRAEVPAEVAAIVRCLLAKKPADRFQSGAALAKALEPWSRPSVSNVTALRTALLAEAAEPASGRIDEAPADPFDFDTAIPAPTPLPVSSGRLTPVPRSAVPSRRRLSWVLGFAALVAVFVAVGAIGAAVVLKGRTKPGDTPPAPVVPPARTSVTRPLVAPDPPPARELEVLEKYLPDDARLVAVFDVNQWQISLTVRQLVFAPLADQLAPIRQATGTDLLAAVERVVVGLPPSERDVVVVLQGRGLVTPRLVDGLRSLPGVAAESGGTDGPELMRMSGAGKDGPLFVAAMGTSVVVSPSRDRVRDAIAKSDGEKRTRFDDPTVARALEYSTARPFATYVALGLRQDWAKLVSAASKLNFVAAAIGFDDRGMHFHTLADESQSGKVAELQKAFGRMLSDQAKSASPPDRRLERIASLLLEAEPTRFPLPKARLTHLHAFIPARGLEEWFAPFLGKPEG